MAAAAAAATISDTAMVVETVFESSNVAHIDSSGEDDGAGPRHHDSCSTNEEEQQIPSWMFPDGMTLDDDPDLYIQDPNDEVDDTDVFVLDWQEDVMIHMMLWQAVNKTTFTALQATKKLVKKRATEYIRHFQDIRDTFYMVDPGKIKLPFSHAKRQPHGWQEPVVAGIRQVGDFAIGQRAANVGGAAMK